ncbi:hypothetical protein B566_EDAN017151 [Ephemera danica]|nr:hypothetical protein B566_EDAN017151 [Ephemera danica]
MSLDSGANLDDRHISLMGIDWLRNFDQIDWNEFKNRKVTATTQEVNVYTQISFDKISNDEIVALIKARFPNLVQNGFGLINGYQARIILKPDSPPTFHKPYDLAIALREPVKKQLESEVKFGILERVKYSEFASPIAAVAKKGTTEVRVCGDFKKTINKHMQLEHYPLPKFSDLSLKWADCTYYTPAFQQCMDRILDGLPGTTAYLDDILVAGRTRAEAKARLLDVLHRLHVHNVRINLKTFHWGPEQQKAFEECKQCFLESPALIPYDPDKPIFIITDASPYGTSAVLYHLDEYNKERPVFFTSKTLNSAQQKYPHHEKEALAVVHAVTKFHKYIFGRKFELYTDNKAIVSLLSQENRNPLPGCDSTEFEVNHVEQFRNAQVPVSLKEVATET